MKISAYQTALLVVLMFNRSHLKRARLTSKTLCVISGRANLRSHFIVQLQAELDDLGLILFESGRGFGLIRYALLDGAIVLSESSLIADELAEIERDNGNYYDFSEVKEELGLVKSRDFVRLGDDFSFDDDEPVVKKSKKKHAKKAKKTFKDEQDALQDTEFLEEDKEKRLNF